MWVVLLCFPSHCQHPETGLTSGLGAWRRDNRRNAPSDPREDLRPVAQLMGFWVP